MPTPLVQEIEKRYMKSSLPDIRPGDSVKVKIKIKEGNKERLQAYEGVVIKIRGEGINKSATVRRVFQGIGVERVFLLHSPKVESIQVLRKGSVRRAKLYYLRDLTGKAARIREKVGSAIALAAEAKAAKAQAEAEAAAAVQAQADAKAAAEAQEKAEAEAKAAEAAKAAQEAEAAANEPVESAPETPEAPAAE